MIERLPRGPHTFVPVVGWPAGTFRRGPRLIVDTAEQWQLALFEAQERARAGGDGPRPPQPPPSSPAAPEPEPRAH